MPTDAQREIATTRALLMALARPRAFFFETSLPATVVLGVGTLGIWPLVMLGGRLERLRRYEWMLFEAFATWLADRADPSECEALAATSRRMAASRGRVWVSGLIVGTVLALVGSVVARLVWPAHVPREVPLAAVIVAVVSQHFALLGLLSQLDWQRRWTRAYCRRLSRLLVSDGFREVRPPASRRSIWEAFAALPVVPVGFAALQNRFVREFRPVHMQLVERMLELTDDSGLPVEFDVEAIAPEAFVHARAEGAAA